MEKKKLAAYVVGDENIGVGALAALSSFQSHNEGIDLFLFSYIDKLDQKISNELSSLKVKLIDISTYIDKVDVFGSYSSGELHWPKETFLNYYVPYILGEQYEYLVKLDYDLLTIEQIEFSRLLPKNHQILSSIYNPFSLYSMVRENKEYYIEKYNVSPEYMKQIGINTGFLVINVKKYLEEDVFEGMINLLLEINADNPEIASAIYADQGLLTMYIGFNSLATKKISDCYNLTAIILRNYSGKEIVNIHFTGKVKPWKNLEVDSEFLDTFGLPFYILIPKWREFMQGNHPEVYKQLGINNNDDVIGIVLEYTAMQNKKQKDTKREQLNYNSRKYLVKEIIKITLKQLGLRK